MVKSKKTTDLEKDNYIIAKEIRGKCIYEQDEQLKDIGLDCTNKELLQIFKDNSKDALYFSDVDLESSCNIFLDVRHKIYLACGYEFRPITWDKGRNKETNPSKLRLNMQLTCRQTHCLFLAIREAYSGRHQEALHEFMDAISNCNEPERRISHDEALLYCETIDIIIEALKK